MKESEKEVTDLHFSRLEVWLNFWKMIAIFILILIIVIFLTVYISDKYFKIIELDYQLKTKKQENLAYYLSYARETNQTIPASLMEKVFATETRLSQDASTKNIATTLPITPSSTITMLSPATTKTTKSTETNHNTTTPSAENVTVSGQASTGLASYYADKFQGRPTASGEAFDNNAMTAAHRTLPFGTMLKVTHTKTGAAVVVKVNDRGPFIKNKMIDLSKAAAKKLGIIQAGHGEVTIEKVVSKQASNTNSQSENMYKN